MRHGRHDTRRRARWLAVFVATAALLVTAPAEAAQFSYDQTIAVPPASTYAGSGGGDGWAVALTPSSVFNVFHHSSEVQVACHRQSDASECWPVRTVRDAMGGSFAVSGQPGLWLDPETRRLYVFAIQAAGGTGGVVCIDTDAAATEINPFCGFTALTAPGDAPYGSAGISNSTLVDNRLYAFNYVDASGDVDGRNALLCFDTVTRTECDDQPFAVPLGGQSLQVVNPDYWVPAVAQVGSRIVIPFLAANVSQMACYDAALELPCPGEWPIDGVPGQATGIGAVYPTLSLSGEVTGLCVPASSSCFTLAGEPAPAPAGVVDALGGGTQWNGPALTIGPRVYRAMNSPDRVGCYDFNLLASCQGFPRATPGSNFIYTVNPDPARPTCIWINADGGSAQIQNFDAFTTGTCGTGPLRVLASSIVVPRDECRPSSYLDLTVVSPAREGYGSATVNFQDASGQPIPGAADRVVDAGGIVDLRGLSLNTRSGLPQFLITFEDAQAQPDEVVIRLRWIGDDDPVCLRPGTTGAPPGRPTLTAPDDGALVGDDGTVTVAFALGAEAGSHEILLDGTAVKELPVPSDHALISVLGNGIHTLAVRARNAFGTADSDSRSVRATGPDAEEVVLEEPEPGQVVDDDQVFRWRAFTGASEYLLLMDGRTAATTTQTTVRLPGEIASGEHHWQVIAILGAAGRATRADTQRSSRTRKVTVRRTPSTAPSALGSNGAIARAYRPYLFFDSEERYRPVTVRALIGEGQVQLQRRVRRVEDGIESYEDVTRSIKSPDDLYSTFRALGQGHSWNNAATRMLYPRTSRYDECRQRNRLRSGAVGPVRLTDCDTGTHAGIYFQVAQPNRIAAADADRRSLVWVDWWWLLRGNPIRGDNHGGDWEGVSVAVGPQSGDVALVTFASHKGVNRYLDGVVIMHRGRPEVYLSQRSHAAYPRPCIKASGTSVLGNVVEGDCWQEYIEQSGPNLIRETRYDGESPWGRNSNGSCFAIPERPCTLQLKHPDGEDDTPTMSGLSRTWNTWLGRWGAKKGISVGDGPTAPGSPQSRFSRPWRPSVGCGIPTSGRRPDDEGYFSTKPPQNDECVELRAAAPQAAGTIGEAGSCADYAGPYVAAAVCDQRQLTDAGIAGELTLRGTVTIATSRAGERVADAPGIGQAAGMPLAPGRSASMTGTAPRTTEALVRVHASDGLTKTVLLRDLRLQDGGQATFIADRSGGGTLVRGDGTRATVQPTPGSRAVQVPRVVRVRALGRTLRVTITGAVDRLATVTVRGTRASSTKQRTIAGRAVAHHQVAADRDLAPASQHARAARSAGDDRRRQQQKGAMSASRRRLGIGTALATLAFAACGSSNAPPAQRQLATADGRALALPVRATALLEAGDLDRDGTDDLLLAAGRDDQLFAWTSRRRALTRLRRRSAQRLGVRQLPGRDGRRRHCVDRGAAALDRATAHLAGRGPPARPRPRAAPAPRGGGRS